MSLRRALPRLLAAVLLVAVVTACSSDDDGGDGAAAVDDGAAATADAGSSDEGGEDAAPDDDGGDNPSVLGYEVDGPAGTTVVVVSNLVADGQEQPPLTATWSITDRPRSQLYSPFVDSGELELEVTEGGPATVTAIRGRYVDVEDPSAGIELEERLGQVEVAGGSTATLALP